MTKTLSIEILEMTDCVKNPMEIGLDDDWAIKNKYFDHRMSMRGVYIIHTTDPTRIIYIGKTRGPSMDFQTRLYRHATSKASQNSRVYLRLKQISKDSQKSILVSLITSEQLRSLYNGEKLTDAAMIDIYEQLLIHLFKPEVNS